MRAVVLGLVLALAPALASAQGVNVAADAQAALAGPWIGTWTSGPYVYDGEMTLSVSAEGEVDGQIVWTLREADAELAPLIGRSGVEHVRGRFHPDTGALRLEGHQKDDPDNVIGLDSYRLVVGRNHAMLTGLTGNHGTWDGLVVMRR